MFLLILYITQSYLFTINCVNNHRFRVQKSLVEIYDRYKYIYHKILSVTLNYKVDDYLKLYHCDTRVSSHLSFIYVNLRELIPSRSKSGQVT